MKYGHTLVQRSIPEWGHYNIDYDYLKDLIKQHTTPGHGTALSIPGQGSTTETAFRDTFFQVLKSQHDRINLFVKSKSGEIERRLDYIGRQLAQLQARQPSTGPLPARAVENYARIDADAHRAGEEIRSLSRFQTAQRTGFYKILKKYKRWAKDHELERRFKADVIGRADSFFHLDLGFLLERYIEVLDALRDALPRPDEISPRIEALQLSAASRLFKATERGDPIDFDVAVGAVPLGTQGTRATYWIHPDHIVEVEILLLQHLRPFAKPHAAVMSPRRSRQASPFRHRPATGVEDEVGFVVLDEPHAFARRQNGCPVGASEEVAGATPFKAAGLVKWTSMEPAAAVTQQDAKPNASISPETITVTKLRKRQIEALLTSDATAHDERAAVQSWLRASKDILPIASVGSKRTRFLGLNNSTMRGKWAVLDKDITMDRSLPACLCSNQPGREERAVSSQFPYAVLEVRSEGAQSTELIQLLDSSHLVERVRGFSLEAHAVWICCRPDNMSRPAWISLLENKDIRKLPEPVKRQRRKGTTSTTDSGSAPTPSGTSTSATAATSPHHSHTTEASIPGFTEPPPLRAFKKKKKQYSEYFESDNTLAPQGTQRYWNEYDNPESEDEGYYIYLDPNASTKLPGQELFEAVLRRARALLRFRKEEESVSRVSTANTASSVDDEDTSDESPLATPGRPDYGTLPFPARPQRRSSRKGYVSSLLSAFSSRWRADDEEDAQALGWQDPRAREALLIEIHTRHREREMAILKLYSSLVAAAAIIDIILAVLVTTSRRKLKGQVDIAVLLGVVANLVLVLVAVTSFCQRRERVGWVHGFALGSLVGGMVMVDAVLLKWAVVP
ncbi:uncharacterized protein EI97DRAFT_388574 [Westerdykella ornata]|uniref:SPX domain-containing protein n=1 Tax=Westerdykella ornata TaxID=318751 RepID=A0A6A6JW44_WESOR|nr:uncharacterized protein EI97DRAFT_388574 [Westerdykella ornata]KAF2280627.1 hypothetical protein EI97DRAFT_388574 [Westerdykella ornata]